MNLYITKSTRKNKKYDLLDSDKKYLLSFGDNRYQDYTIHKNQTRQANYLSRHGKANENWNKSGIYTSGFMSRWLLWNKPTLETSIRDVNKRFNINVKLI
jgi:hypothetical protein